MNLNHICSLGLGLGLGILISRNQRSSCYSALVSRNSENDSSISKPPKNYAPKEFHENSLENSKTLTRASNHLSTTIFNTIRKRRSIFPKDFTGEQVPVSIVEECLAAANWAPTHGKTQPWRFIVCGNSVMEKISSLRDVYMESILEGEALEKYRKKVIRKRNSIKNTSYTIFIMVKAVTTSTGRRMKEWEEIAAVSMAVQNFHLQLTTYWNNGIGGYWSSGGVDSYLKNSKDIRELLGAENGQKEEGVPDDIILGAFHLGCVLPSKMNKYKSSRGDIKDKVKWMK
jgi:nitroreductase